MKSENVLQVAGFLIYCALSAGAQTQTPQAPASASTPTPAQTPAPDPAPAAVPTWSLGSLDFSGYIDGYYSYNANRPSNTANGQANDLYNFNDKSDQFNLSAVKLTKWVRPWVPRSQLCRNNSWPRG